MIKLEILSDEEIRITKAEAERLSWTHKAHPSYEKDKYLLQTQRDKDYKEMLGQIREILNSMAPERCDPDVMPYFTDYYWMPEDIWQALQAQLEEG